MSFYWYDFETFGADPFRDRPAQFAGIRTDEAFNPIGDPLVIYCQPANDFLPQPDACLITGITPQLAQSKGVCEAEFIAQIHQQFAQPNTCVVGYNSIRFDDEVTRNCLYRNFYDPYAREWQQGNSRWDIIDMVRLTRTVRPEGINWPDHEDGRPSFKLEQLSVANQIEHAAAHDALSDVWATIGLARLIKEKQPRLYEYLYQHRDKKRIAQQLDLREQKPVLHISGKYPAQQGSGAIVVPLARDKVNKNAIYVYDLNVDPQPLLSLSPELIRERIFTATEMLPEGVERVPLKAIHINKCPVVVPVNLVTDEVAERLAVDVQRCLSNLERIRSSSGLDLKVQQVFDSPFESSSDPDLMLYGGGFFSTRDRHLMDTIRSLPPEQLAGFKEPAKDPRIPEMLFRYRARNYLHTLDEQEQQTWNDYRMARIMREDGGGSICLDHYQARIEELRGELTGQPEKLAILDQLEDYAKQIVA